MIEIGLSRFIPTSLEFIPATFEVIPVFPRVIPTFDKIDKNHLDSKHWAEEEFSKVMYNKKWDADNFSISLLIFWGETMELFKNDWETLLHDELKKPYYLRLTEFLKKEYATNTIYPNKQEIFNALDSTSFDNTKVVILGQDPYHGQGQAHGLSFSVKEGVKKPPSLKNIFKELQSDLGCKIPSHGCLQSWAEQGVLLLNTVLTVKDSTANSHKGVGWEEFTGEIISLLNRREKPLVFILWGLHAQKKKKLITAQHHYLIESAHPSPLSAYRGFFGSQPFSKTNQFLRLNDCPEIDWDRVNM